MTIESSGTLGLNGTCTGGSSARNQIGAEIPVTAGTALCLNNSTLRSISGTSSGTTVSFSTFYGKSNRANIGYTYCSSTANASLNVTSISGYSAGKSCITITVNSGIYLYATSTANAGLTLTGGTTGDVITLVNKGYIMGQGGVGYGKNCGNYTTITNTPGGPALSLGFDTTINNTNGSAYIGGGGGGGGGSSCQIYGGGGGAGGGGGGGVAAGICCTTYYFRQSSGGGIGAVGQNGTNCSTNPIGSSQTSIGSAGGGGRIFPGTGGAGLSFNVTAKGGGAGGGGSGINNNSAQSGSGGSSNNAGTPPTGSYTGGGGGGGWGAAGGSARGSGVTTGSSGGKAVQLNGHTATFTSCCKVRVYGAIA
jgi:hypothetical protein